MLTKALEGVRSLGAAWCYLRSRGRDVIPKPGCKVFKGEIGGLVEPGDERVRRFGIGRDTRGVNG
jgi:hypothetical protein